MAQTPLTSTPTDSPDAPPSHPIPPCLFYPPPIPAPPPPCQIQRIHPHAVYISASNAWQGHAYVCRIMWWVLDSWPVLSIAHVAECSRLIICHEDVSYLSGLLSRADLSFYSLKWLIIWDWERKMSHKW